MSLGSFSRLSPGQRQVGHFWLRGRGRHSAHRLSRMGEHPVRRKTAIRSHGEGRRTLHRSHCDLFWLSCLLHSFGVQGARIGGICCAGNPVSITPMGRALLARPPKRVWGVTRNVTDNSPTRVGVLCVAIWCPKHTGVSVVASAFAKSVTFRGTLLGPFCSSGAVWSYAGSLRAAARSEFGKLVPVPTRLYCGLVVILHLFAAF